jgi:transcriptional regulator with XRE-family HTH domain
MDLRKSAIAQGLKNLRLEKNYTQDFVASILGKGDGSAVYRLENGKADLNLEDAAKLAELYEVTIDEIYDPSKRYSGSGVSDSIPTYQVKNKLQVSVTLDGTPLGLQKQIDLLTKVNAILAETSV